MKTKELVAHLLTGDQEAEVGTFGWFGEFLPMHLCDFHFRTIKKGHNPQGHVGTYLEIDPVDRGPEPE